MFPVTFLTKLFAQFSSITAFILQFPLFSITFLPHMLSTVELPLYHLIFFHRFPLMKRFVRRPPIGIVTTKAVFNFLKQILLGPPNAYLLMIMQSPAQMGGNVEHQSQQQLLILKTKNFYIHHQSLQQRYYQQIYPKTIHQNSQFPQELPAATLFLRLLPY